MSSRNRVTGMYSGMDTESIISQLVEAKKTKVTNATKEQMTIKYKQDIWTDLNKKLKSLKSSVDAIKYKSAYLKKTTSVSDSTYASVSTSDNAMYASQSLKVNSLAKAGYLTGAELKTTTTSEDGTTEKATSATLLSDLGIETGKSISITTGGTTTNVEITEGMTIDDLTTKLSDAGVNVNFDSASQRIFIGAKSTGADSDFTLGGDADTLKALGLSTDDGATKIDGTDAEIVLNGATFTSNTNVFEINGLTITAKAETGDKELTLTTENDVSGIYDMIKNVITQYSEIINEMDKLYNADTDSTYSPLTDEEKSAMSEYEIEKWDEKIKEQVLAKDSTISNISSTLENVFQSGIEINGKTYYLANFGIETAGYFESADDEKHALHIYGDADDSLYSSEENTLKNMISTDPDLVTDFFSELSKNLYTAMDSLSSKISGYRSYGSFYDDVKYKSDYSDYSTKISELEEKLEDYEDKWYDKFSAMETALAKMQSNSSAVTSLLGG